MRVEPLQQARLPQITRPSPRRLFMPATFSAVDSIPSWLTANAGTSTALTARSAIASEQPAVPAAAEPAVRVPLGADQAVLGHVPGLRRRP